MPAAVNQTKPEPYHFKVRLLYTSSRTTWATYNNPVKQNKTKHFLGIRRALEKMGKCVSNKISCNETHSRRKSTEVHYENC